MANPNQCVVTVSNPPRSTATQNPVQFVASECSATWSWGLQPSTALIDWVSITQQPAIVSLSSMKIEFGGQTFYGYCKSVVPKLGSDGITLMQEFVDNRDFLMWDVVYCVFNMPEHKIVDGQFIRRYWHILPADFNTRTKTYTNAPYAAETILDFLFNAGTVESPWNRNYFSTFTEFTAMGTPVFQLDWENGVLLGQAVLQISEAIGMVFTLIDGPYTLLWTIKGLGVLPTFPANSDNRRDGSAVVTNPTRVRILGDRNRYQVLNCVMLPDWLQAWQENFGFSFADFISDIFYNESTDAAVGTIPGGVPYTSIPGDTDFLVGRALAEARARLLTVGQYADLRDARDESGDLFRDTRRFQGRSRTQIPVYLYLTQILWRAFRLPDDFTIRLSNRLRAGLLALDMEGRSIVDVTHDPITGVMTPTNLIPSSEHNGYAIIQGYQVASDAFGSLNPDYFNVNDWLNGQSLWSTASFQIDDSGEGDQFILFDQPVFQSGDLIKQIAIDEVPQTFTDGRARVAVSADPTLIVPQVRAALTFAGEKFSFVDGIGTRDGVENVTGLNGEYLGFSDGRQPQELAFADGQLASDKAAEIATTLLNLQFLYAYGGYTVQGSNATQLTSMIDRVTLRLDASGGLTEEVDFTNERARQVSYNGNTPVVHVEPEREFDRKAQLAPLFPGQEQLRTESNQLKLTAAALEADPRQARMIADEFHLLMGLDAPPQNLQIDGGETSDFDPLPAGCPMWREATDSKVLMPNNTTADSGANVLDSPVFMGVTVQDGSDPANTVPSTMYGTQGIVQVRVQLAATDTPTAGESVGLNSDNGVRDYLSLNPGTPVGTLMDDFSNNTSARIVIARVRLFGGGTSKSVSEYKGLYVPGEYDKLEEVTVQSGPGAGTYASTADKNTNSPLTGINWIQISSLTQWF